MILNDNDNKINNIQKTYFGDLITKCGNLKNWLSDIPKSLSKKDQESKGIRQLDIRKKGI